MIAFPVTYDDFFLALEAAAEEKAGNFRERLRIRWALRNDRVRRRVFARVQSKLSAELPMAAGITDVFDWILANWEEIFAILTTIIGMFAREEL